MPVRPNAAKQRLQAGGTILFSSVRLPEPGLCEILGYAGFDGVLLDAEHGALDASTLDRQVQGCFAGNTVPVVRVRQGHDVESIMHALDLGAQGIMIPHCRTAEDARRLQDAAFYPPRGHRGYGPGRGTQWGRVPISEYFATADQQVLLLALIEDIEGVENIEAIAEVGLDVLWVGTGDLAADMGLPGQTDHPRVLEAADHILQTCRQHNIAAGFPARDLEAGVRAQSQGYRVIGFLTAESYVMQMGRKFLSGLGR